AARPPRLVVGPSLAARVFCKRGPPRNRPATRQSQEPGEERRGQPQVVQQPDPGPQELGNDQQQGHEAEVKQHHPSLSLEGPPSRIPLRGCLKPDCSDLLPSVTGAV